MKVPRQNVSLNPSYVEGGEGHPLPGHSHSLKMSYSPKYRGEIKFSNLVENRYISQFEAPEFNGDVYFFNENEFQ